MSMAFPSSVTAAQSLAALLPYECGVPLAGAYAVPPSPRGRLFVSYPRGRYRGGYYPPEIPPLGLPIPFVPSGHFPLTRGIGLAMTGFFDSLTGPGQRRLTGPCLFSSSLVLFDFGRVFQFVFLPGAHVVAGDEGGDLPPGLLHLGPEGPGGQAQGSVAQDDSLLHAVGGGHPHPMVLPQVIGGLFDIGVGGLRLLGVHHIDAVPPLH